MTTTATLNTALLSREMNCESHGKQTERGSKQGLREIWYGCPACARQRKEQERAARVIELLGQARIPPLYANCTATNFRRIATDHSAAYTAVSSWMDEARAANGVFRPDQPATVLLMGVSGRGKSHLSVASVKSWIGNTTRSALYITAADIESAAVRRFQGGQELIDNLCTTPFLALDELGGEQAGELSRPSVARVITARDAARIPTILCTNLDADSILRRYGQGVADRLLVDGIVCEFAGPSLRGGLAP